MLILLALALFLPSASAQTYQGEWTVDDDRCWRIDVDGVSHSVTPVPGQILYPVEAANVTVEAVSIEESNRCGSNSLLITESHTQTQSVPDEPLPKAAEQGTSWSIPLMAGLFVVVALLAILVTDEGVQYRALSSVSKRKSRTEEATFLRGRIVGFLSANQGLHFSAIADAMDMGNHQAAHHLSILEKDGHLWKRRDGRRLRFYTIEVSQLNKRLPVPLEPPVPDSLPARLLEDIEALEHGVIEGAGQRAIAKRLATSQQLVSHHLRMMEKQGWIIRHGRGRRKVIGLTEHGIEALSESRTAMLTNRPSHNP
jgi:DNA-binding MarR family transcriptional regulator